MNKPGSILMILILGLKSVWIGSALDGLVQSSYWNSYFPHVSSIKQGETVELETDLFQCSSKLRDEKTMRISWKCKTKVPNVVWIPNKRVLDDRKRFVISFTDALGTLYSVPYPRKKILNLCTSTSVDIFGEFDNSGVAILPKDFTFIKVNECINY